VLHTATYCTACATVRHAGRQAVAALWCARLADTLLCGLLAAEAVLHEVQHCHLLRVENLRDYAKGCQELNTVPLLVRLFGDARLRFMSIICRRSVAGYHLGYPDSMWHATLQLHSNRYPAHADSQHLWATLSSYCIHVFAYTGSSHICIRRCIAMACGQRHLSVAADAVLLDPVTN
jgi:hypothetical protein